MKTKTVIRLGSQSISNQVDAHIAKIEARIRALTQRDAFMSSKQLEKSGKEYRAAILKKRRALQGDGAGGVKRFL
jgi:hypothetical protein